LDDKINNISITGDDNINVSKPADGEGGTETPGTGSTSPSFDITMSDNPQFGGHADDGQGHAANGSVTVVGTGTDGTAHKVVVDGATGTVSGLSNTEWDWNKYGKPAEEGGYAGSTNAATESQLQGALEGTVQYDRDENGNVDKTNVTLNKGGDSVTIHNVAAGTADTDAVNVSQLNQAWDQINNNTTAITNIGNKVGELDSRIDEVGAGAAALAALHPLDFDPDDKWDFAAGYGNYRGENAVAIGAFYRPNEDTMFSVGGTVGNGDNMVNAGVSFKLGQGNNVSTSRVAMAKEIKSMRDIVAKQDAQIQKLTAMVNALVGMEAIAPDTTTMFPDVPENHWAYEAVEMMAKTGLVQGYPDGEFKGDRNMTRYEFAQIVYNAIQAGIKVDERLVQEFRPELEYFRIDTISKDKDGNPVIQRVRANEIPATK
ncbi:YadA-like family protein, partial [Megasphaera elsdenii]|uniref:YadA-like family protein n=1 Tax=Megasphaera elsdenii TaxID=907 RepID=UPI002E788000